MILRFVDTPIAQLLRNVPTLFASNRRQLRAAMIGVLVDSSLDAINPENLVDTLLRGDK